MYKSRKYVHPYAFTRILSEEMKKEDIFCADCGGNIVVTNHAFETKTGQHYFTNNGNSPMGFSYSAAKGAYFAADKDKNIVCILSGGNNDITRYNEIMELNMKYLNLKHYFILEFNQNPGQLKQFINNIELKGIETRPIISGSFPNQPSTKLFKLNKSNKKFKGSEYIQKFGFLIGLHTRKVMKKDLLFLKKTLLSIDKL